MKRLLHLTLWLSTALAACAYPANGTADDRSSLEKTTRAIRDGFARGDVAAVVALHHPDVVKYFGGSKVVNGRAELEKGLTDMFKGSTMEFVGNDVESTLFTGDTAVETSIFTVKLTSKETGNVSMGRGRAMVVYVRYKDSPTGWASIREMAQAAPDAK